MRLRRLMLVAAALAGAWAWAGAASAQTRGCESDLYITDQDPAGLNIRSSPAGPILTAVVARNRTVMVELTGGDGAWARIRVAHVEPGAHSDDATVLWQGDGWVAFSKLGLSQTGPRTVIRATADDNAKVVLSYKNRDDTPAPASEVMGCEGGWVKVRVKGVVGWTDEF
jgi:SH3-like domain-containing protein